MIAIRRILCNVLGWHKQNCTLTISGGNIKSHCKYCGKPIMRDSQGNWFLIQTGGDKNMTCKDCIHNEVCERLPNKYYCGFSRSLIHGEDKCEHFNDKSLYIKLPCKVGDYLEWNSGITISLHRIEGFNYDTTEIENYRLRYIMDWGQPIITHSAIKRIVPREEAEKALKEKDGNTDEADIRTERSR